MVSDNPATPSEPTQSLKKRKSSFSSYSQILKDLPPQKKRKTEGKLEQAAKYFNDNKNTGNIDGNWSDT